MELSNSPSKNLLMIDHKQTKMVNIGGVNMYKNPALDVVFDKNGDFYSNKKQNGFKLLLGNKVHYILNLDGNIIKGNTTKRALMNVMLGKDKNAKFATPVVTKTEATVIVKKAKKASPAKKKTVDAKALKNNEILVKINMIKNQLSELESLVA